MLDNLVLATPSYNSLEYLEVFLVSWKKYAHDYSLVVYHDGPSSEFESFIQSSWVDSEVKEGRLLIYAGNEHRGQPVAYNTCLERAVNHFKASYILMLNDDMVFSPAWSRSLDSMQSILDTHKAYISLNLAWPGPPGYTAVSCPEIDKNPKKFDWQLWHTFSNNYTNKDMYLDKTEFGPGFPFIVSSKVAESYKFDERYSGGGCLDTDFLFSLWLDGFFLERLSNNLLFHFSGGSTDKQKAMGVWVEHGTTFIDKWGIPIGKAMHLIMGKDTASQDDIDKLREINSSHKVV